MTTTGAKPAGAENEAEAAQSVRQMFDAIAPRYDLLNHLLSANVDRLWWRRTARRFKPVLGQPDAAILDICCGTGDMTMALLKHRPAGARPILAADFARGMLSRGARKFSGSRPGEAYAVPLEADALHLPLRSGSLDLIVTAFGFRNLANYEAGLRVQPGAEAGRAVGHSGLQRAGRLAGQGLCGLLPARAAGHRTFGLRQGWAVQLPSHLGGQFSAARRDAQADGRQRVRTVWVAAIYLWHCRVVHGCPCRCSLRAR